MRFFLPVLTLLASLGVAAPASASDQLVGLARAVEVAEHQLAANAIDASLDTRKGRLVYEVELVRADTLHSAQIDARTGRLVSVSKPRLVGLYRRYLEAGRVHHGKRVRPMSSVLNEIEATPGRTVHEATLKADNERLVYEIEVATAAGVAKVRHDAVTGRRLSVAIGQD
ncbi:PepSY domain-containing protein [Sphingomonas jatrophae]|uniref:PepSY domain-containing protein n=1 Tax=Sphingomonas jatrophae TaxID=1166337 RepID=UPI0013F4DE29|nr:PepSY domain-containing protein [Sphingomonas jatrophae]